MSLGARMGNIFVSPSEVFDDVKASPPDTATWLIPTIIGIVGGIIFTFIVFSQPGVIQSMREPGHQAIEKQVSQGKIPRDQADKAIETMDWILSPAILKAFGIVMALFIQPIILFFVSLVLWLVGTYAFGGRFPYMKAVEVVGITSVVMIPGSIVMMLLDVIYGNMNMTPGPVLLISNFNPTNPVHALLNSINLVWIWYLAVLAIGLARLSGTAFVKAACWAFGLWSLLVAVKVGWIILFNHLGGK